MSARLVFPSVLWSASRYPYSCATTSMASGLLKYCPSYSIGGRIFLLLARLFDADALRNGVSFHAACGLSSRMVSKLLVYVLKLSRKIGSSVCDS